MGTERVVTDARAQLAATIAGLLAQRAVLGDALVEAALAPLRDKLAALQAAVPADAPAAAPPDTAAQTLRPLTLLFMDVVGFTALAQRLDAEDLHELIDGTLARCSEIVVAHGGRVMQYAGDQLLAAFGALQAQEDDAERAVRCGLALRAEGRALGERTRTLAGPDATADVRVGIHSGPALLGGGVDGDGTVRGVAVNIAARMEQSAPPGGLRISRDTWRLVRGLFELEAQPPLELKGLAAAQATWLVHGERRAADAQRGVDGITTPLVGRTGEVAALHTALAQAIDSRQLQRLTLLADAGLGKSRLLATIAQDAAVRARVHRMRAARHGLHQPYGVLRHWLALQLGLSDSDDADTARARLRAGFGSSFDDPDEASALVGQLIGLDFAHSAHVQPLANDARQLRQRAFDHLAQWLLQLAAQTPQVLLLDDMHWADDGSLDAVDHFAAACAGAPVLLAVFARPALRERRPAWCETAMVLTPLASEAATELLDALLQRAPDAPAALRTQLLTHADGNPFHLEELVAMCLDDGVFVATPGGSWQVDAARLRALRVPPTLAGVLQARLDGLGAAERRALQQASVVGHVHWDRALQHLEPGAEQRLPALASRELVRPHADSVFDDAREFAFKHHLLHQATYDTVLKRERRGWHRRTAEWLVQTSGDRIGEHLALVAEHFERAGEVTEAVAWWLRADDAALRAAAYAAAEHHLERAQQLLPALDAAPTEADRRTHFELLSRRIRISNATGRRDLQPAVLALMETLAEQLDDDRLRATVASHRGLLLLVTGAHRDSLVQSERTVAWATAAGEPLIALFPLANKGLAHHFLGEPEAARTALHAALSLARACGRPDAEVAVRARLAIVARAAGDSTLRLAHLEAGLAIAREAGLLRLQATTQTNLATWDLDVGQLDSAHERASEGLQIARRIGDAGSEPYALSALALVAEERGQHTQALALTQQALALARAAGDANQVAALQRTLGTCFAVLGQAEEAHAAWAASDAALQHRADHAPGAHPQAIALALAAGDITQARTLADAQLAQLPAELEARIDGASTLQLLWLDHRVALAEGDGPRAAAALARAHAHLEGCRALVPAANRESWTRNRHDHRVIADAWAASQQV